MVLLVLLALAVLLVVLALVALLVVLDPQLQAIIVLLRYPRRGERVPRKAGPVVTDNGMWLIGAPFPLLLLLADRACRGVFRHDGWKR